MTNTTCVMCGAFEEWDVHPSYHPERGKAYLRREKPCRCPKIEAARVVTADMTGTCRCGAPVHYNAKQCPTCSAVAAAARHTETTGYCLDCGFPLRGKAAKRCKSCQGERTKAKGRAAAALKLRARAA